MKRRSHGKRVHAAISLGIALVCSYPRGQAAAAVTCGEYTCDAWGCCGEGCYNDGHLAWSSCRHPARSVPPALWGQLRPTDTANDGWIPSVRDTTSFNEFKTPGSWTSGTQPHWWNLDVQNGWVFTASRTSFQIWDARVNPGNPTRVAMIQSAGFPLWHNNPHEYDPVRVVSTPPANDDVAAVGIGHQGGGLVVFDTTTKNAPSWRYGDVTSGIYAQVHTANINGRDFAFAADLGGLLAYDLTAALTLPAPCLESSKGLMPHPPTGTCPNVYLGRVGARNGHYVHGVSDAAGNAHYLTHSGGLGVQLWNVSNPSGPQLSATVLADQWTGLLMNRQARTPSSRRDWCSARGAPASGSRSCTTAWSSSSRGWTPSPRFMSRR
jgi:hypothetical protein